MIDRYRHAYLLASLSLLIVFGPFFAEFGHGVFRVLLAITLLTSIATCSTNRYQAWFGIAMTAVILGSPIAVDALDAQKAAGVAPAMGLVYFSFVAWVVLRKVFLSTDRVSADTIQGAICGYLLLGLAWAYAYELLAEIEPGSFVFSTAEFAASEHVEKYLAFSFVTLTTLGYGNVVPATPRADAIAIAEAVVGQIFVAVLLARLVALELAQRREDSRS